MSSGMRNRKKGGGSGGGKESETGGGDSKSTSLDLQKVDFAKLMEKAAPYIAALQAFGNATVPYIEMAHQKCVEAAEKAAPYRLDLLLPALIGLILCFFGGTFVTIIAAVEAYRQLGYASTVNALNDIKNDWR